MAIQEETRCEPLKARILMTETGYPAHISIVRDAYKDAQPAPEDGWFWVFATPRAAADIRRRGLHAVGTLTTTFIPQQEAPKIYDLGPEWVPVVGSQEHTELMIAETHASHG
jgi:hypothetical protein